MTVRGICDRAVARGVVESELSGRVIKVWMERWMWEREICEDVKSGDDN